MDTYFSYPISEAKAKLGELIRRTQDGDTITVTNNGTPAVVLVTVADYVRFTESHIGTERP